MKRCTKCGETKPLNDFTRDGDAKDGKAYQCRECVRDTRSKKYAADPEKGREVVRQWRKANIEKCREQAKARRKANPEKARESYRRWCKKHPEMFREIARKRRDKNYANLAKKFGPTCLDCRAELPMQIFEYHHLDPTTKNGNLKVPNWTWKRIEIYTRGCVQLCPTCHRLRHFFEREKRHAALGVSK